MDESVLKLMECYTVEDLRQIETIESYFRFERFTNSDALKLGLLIVDACQHYKGGVAIVITDVKNDSVIFQHIMDGKTNRHIQFANKKKNATLKSGHSSIWNFIHGALNHEDIQTLFNDNCVSSSGCFPIYVNQKLAFTVAVSGLHNGDDFRVVMDAFSLFTGIKIPEINVSII